MLDPAVALIGAAAAYALPAGLASSPANAGVRVYKRIRDPQRVALTFDDGPQPGVLEQFLKLLSDEDVRATFFVVGASVLTHPRLLRELRSAGHEIASHGFTHRNHLLCNPFTIAGDIERGADAIAEVVGVRPVLYRPPYGILSAATRLGAWRARTRVVLWSRWGRDWARSATPDSIARRATRHLRGGDIVLLHDADQFGTPGSWRKTLAALPYIIDQVRRLGLEPSAIGGTEALRW